MKQKEWNKDENVMLIMTHSTNNILPEIHQFTPVEQSLQPAPDIDEFWKLETVRIIPPEKTKAYVRYFFIKFFFIHQMIARQKL